MKKILVLSAVLFLAACAQTVEHRPLSVLEYQSLNFEDAGGKERWWGDIAPPDLMETLKSQSSNKKKVSFKAPKSEENLLALSGGGANGAFGAGLLAGWTQSGQRPDFQIVTGVSTGAIIAPFAFLGADYDDELLNIYKSTTKDKVYQPKIFSGLVSGSAVSDTTSLKNQIKKHVTPALIDKIAVEYRKGRNLFLVTTHFDAMRPMVWDIGYIANHREEDGIDLIRDIILASAAIPVLFPPVAIEWQADGKAFTELHVDGGMTRSVFAYPAKINVAEIDRLRGTKVKRNIYVVMNGNAELRYEPAPTGVLGIAERATFGLLQNQANADLERIYYLARRDNIGFQTIEIPDSFIADGSTEFDPIYMKELLKIGYEIGQGGDFWYNKPPSER